jgi:hypothetical protein
MGSVLDRAWWKKMTPFRVFFGVSLVLSFFVAADVLFRRVAFEAENRQVELVVSYRDLRHMAHLNGVAIEDVLPRLKEEAGITSVGVEEETVEEFLAAGKATLLQGSQILDMYRIGAIAQRSVVTFLYSEYRVDPLRSYFIVEQRADFERLRRFLEAEFGSARVRSLDRHNVIEVLGEKDDLLLIGLGISEDTVALVKAHGLGVIPRLANTSRMSEDVVRQKLNSLKVVDFVNVVIFDGTAVLGYPSFLPLVAEKLTYSGMNIGLVEFSIQSGIYGLAALMPTSVFRVHSMSDGEIDKLSIDQAISRYVRAAKERSNLILFLKPYQVPADQGTRSVIDYNIGYFRQVHDALVSRDFVVGKVRQLPLEHYAPIRPIEWIVLSFGVLACFLGLVNVFKPVRFWVLGAALCVWLIVNYVVLVTGAGLLWLKCLALITACVVPALAVITQYPQDQMFVPSLSVRVYRAVLLALRVAGIALGGGLLVAALLSDIRFLVGVDQFFGVKISFMVPLILMGVFFFLRPHRVSAFLYVFRRLFFAPVRTSFLVACVFCLIFMFVYIVRSGNAVSFDVPVYETWFREGLETLLFVRPRTKEFLIGYPFLMIGVLYMFRPFFQNWLWFFNVLGAVALVSVVNSFCHVHTPLFISVYRCFLGVFFGVLCGLGYVFLFYLVRRGMRRFL